MSKTYNTIEELIEAPENEHFQFKEAKERYDFEKAVKVCCALSNDGGGKLVLGITDKRPRKVVNSNAFPQPERTVESLMSRLHIHIDFEIHKYKGNRVLVFNVASRPIGLLVLADGLAWRYKGDSLEIIPLSEYPKIFAEAGHDFSDEICSGATIDDLDENAIADFRNRWYRKSGNKNIKNISNEQLLRDCEAITDSGVTYAALILFGTSAALRKHLALSEIVFEYRSKLRPGPADARENFRIGFFACFDEIWKLIDLRNTKQSYQEGFFLFDVNTFNERITRETILNAVSHRNYQTEGSIFITQYPDKLVIDSPGGFPHGITEENILTRQKPRNRRIAEIFALCGLVERAGQGMDLIYELSIRDAKPLPDFEGTDDYLVRLTLNGIMIDDRFMRLLNKIGEERMEAFVLDDFLIIDALYREVRLADNLRKRTKRLADMGIIEHIGNGKYILARSFYEAAGKSGVHTRLAGLDRETNKQLILKHIKSKGETGTPLNELQQVLPNCNRSQIQVLLRELREEKRIFMEGTTKSAKWFAR